MSMRQYLFLNVYRDASGQIWAKARIGLADGSFLALESRVYRDTPAPGDGVLGGDDEDMEPAKNRALDEALDKLCKLTEHRAIMRAIPLPARLALRLVCTARNVKKIQQAAEEEGDDELAGAMGRKLSRFRQSEKPTAQRAYRALSLWQ